MFLYEIETSFEVEVRCYAEKIKRSPTDFLMAETIIMRLFAFPRGTKQALTSRKVVLGHKRYVRLVILMKERSYYEIEV